MFFKRERNFFSRGNEGVVRHRWRKNTAGRLHKRRCGHVATDKVPVRWRLDLNMGCLVYCTCIVEQMYANSRHGQGLLEITTAYVGGGEGFGGGSVFFEFKHQRH